MRKSQRSKIDWLPLFSFRNEMRIISDSTGVLDHHEG
jgi:hypothetical protein